LLGDCNARISREYTFQPKVGSDNLHEIRNENGFRVVNFSTSKIPTVRNKMFPIVMFINLLGHLLMERKLN
jgi:hypothetical protein